MTSFLFRADFFCRHVSSPLSLAGLVAIVLYCPLVAHGQFQVQAGAKHTMFFVSPVPDSLSEAQRKWMQILNAPAPAITDQEIEAQELITKLRELGLPVVVDQTALDDQLSEEEALQVPFAEQPLYGRLMEALKSKNATLCLKQNHIRIISLDNSEDPEFQTVIVYEVSSIPLEKEMLWNGLMTALDEESFQWQGGGQSITLLQSGQQNLLVLRGELEIHIELRQFLGSLMSLSGAQVGTFARPMIATAVTIANATNSDLTWRQIATPVALPASPPKPGIHIPDNSRKNLGVMGGMGGTFSVPPIR